MKVSGAFTHIIPQTTIVHYGGIFHVPGRGFEPRLGGPNPPVLPLDDPGCIDFIPVQPPFFNFYRLTLTAWRQSLSPKHFLNVSHQLVLLLLSGFSQRQASAISILIKHHLNLYLSPQQVRQLIRHHLLIL